MADYEVWTGDTPPVMSTYNWVQTGGGYTKGTITFPASTTINAGQTITFNPADIKVALTDAIDEANEKLGLNIPDYEPVDDSYAPDMTDDEEATRQWTQTPRFPSIYRADDTYIINNAMDEPMTHSLPTGQVVKVPPHMRMEYSDGIAHFTASK